LGQEGFNLWLGDGGDKVKAFFLKSLDLQALDHTAIANEGDLATSKTLGDLIDL
jgi:hypothetical protein